MHRRKYEKQQFLNYDVHMLCPVASSASSSYCDTLAYYSSTTPERKHQYEQKHTNGHHRAHGFGHFRHSRRRKDSDHHRSRKGCSTVSSSGRNGIILNIHFKKIHKCHFTDNRFSFFVLSYVLNKCKQAKEPCFMGDLTASIFYRQVWLNS